MTKKTKTPFDFDSFRTDIINNEKFEHFKKTYGFKTRKEVDLKLVALMRLDKKFYDYKSDPVIKSDAVYESKDGFVKISKRKVEEFKSTLGLEKLVLGEVKLDGNQIIIEVKAA